MTVLARRAVSVLSLCALSACFGRATPVIDGGSHVRSDVDASADAQMGCGQQLAVSGPQVDIMIVQDKSASMNHDADEMTVPLNSATTKWNQIRPAIESVVSNIFSIEWGLWLFAIRNNTDGCGVALNPDVAIGAGAAHGEMIKNVLASTSPAGSTPTTGAILQATQYLAALMNGHKHYLLLATDGEPNCNQSAANDTDAAVAAITAAADIGIPTIVVGVGNTMTAQASLTQMAIAGGMPNTTSGASPTYFGVNTTTELQGLLSSIVSDVVSCELALNMPPAEGTSVSVDSNVGPIAQDPTGTSGWNFGPGNQSIIFAGEDCRKLKTGVLRDLVVTYNCIG